MKFIALTNPRKVENNHNKKKIPLPNKTILLFS